MNLTLHMKIHSKDQKKEEPTLQCDVCTKVFRKKKAMRMHLMRHTKNYNPLEEQYHKFMIENFDMKCDQCDYNFTTFYNARNHYKEKHNENNGYLKCCNVKLKTNVFVHDHIKSHLMPDSFK